MELKDKKILIVGFGKSGQATANYCLEHGAIVAVTDLQSASSFDLRTYAPTHLRTFFGSHPPHIFEWADIVVVSPGVPLNLKELIIARKRGCPIIGEMELVLDKINAPIIAVTGTNGKSTVTTLIGEFLKEAGKKVMVGGNLGTPLVEMLTSNFELRTSNFVVLEVSSYQLELAPSFHPYIAVLLNVTPDHLDRYESFDAYIAAKELIIKNQQSSDYIIYNEEDEIVKRIAQKSKAKKIGFSVKRGSELDLSRAVITGVHNKENILAAACAAKIAGCNISAIQKTVEKFKGLPHRNQFVREVKGVKFYDDSKGTNVGAVVKSLEGFDSKVVLIAGGLDKGGSYDPLKPLVKEKVKAMVLIGTSREKIAGVFRDITKVVMADSMAEAVRSAAKEASAGDAVLLSPACASMDMFKDYAERGNKFAEEVLKL